MYSQPPTYSKRPAGVRTRPAPATTVLTRSTATGLRGVGMMDPIPFWQRVRLTVQRRRANRRLRGLGESRFPPGTSVGGLPSGVQPLELLTQQVFENTTPELRREQDFRFINQMEAAAQPQLEILKHLLQQARWENIWLAIQWGHFSGELKLTNEFLQETGLAKAGYNHATLGELIQRISGEAGGDNLFAHFLIAAATMLTAGAASGAFSAGAVAAEGAVASGAAVATSEAAIVATEAAIVTGAEATVASAAAAEAAMMEAAALGWEGLAAESALQNATFSTAQAASAAGTATTSALTLPSTEAVVKAVGAVNTALSVAQKLNSTNPTSENQARVNELERQLADLRNANPSAFTQATLMKWIPVGIGIALAVALAS